MDRDHRKTVSRDYPYLVCGRVVVTTLQSEIAESGMPIRTAPKRPMKFAIGLLDREIIDAREPQTHQAVFIEFPILVSVGAQPVAGVVMAFISEAHGDAISVMGPEFFDEPIVQFPAPLAFQECNDLLPSGRELGAVSPARIDGIRQRYFFGIARIPAVFGE